VIRAPNSTQLNSTQLNSTGSWVGRFDQWSYLYKSCRGTNTDTFCKPTCFSDRKEASYSAWAAPAGWQGALAPVPYAPGCLPRRREKIIRCALSTLPVHCRSVKFM